MNTINDSKYEINVDSWWLLVEIILVTNFIMLYIIYYIIYLIVFIKDLS